MMKFTKSIDLHYLMKKTERGGFIRTKLEMVVASTNIRSGIRASTDAKASIRHKSEPSIAGKPFRNQTGFAKQNTKSHATARTITLIGATDYYSYQEFGTKKMSAHPVLRPALERQSGYIGKQLETEIINFYIKR